MISYAAITEYYNMYMQTPTSKKYYQNRINWAYYILRNLIAYGKFPLTFLISIYMFLYNINNQSFVGSFPIDHLVHIIVLLYFHELSWKIHDSYI